MALKRSALAIVTVIVVAAAIVGGAFFIVRSRRAAGAGDTPAAATARVERGPIRLAVASTGRVISNLDVDIKCRASGEVVKLPFDVSDRVKAGDLLFELEPTNEQRQVGRARAALAEAEARAKYARLKANRLKETMEQKLSSRDEYDAADASATEAEAQADACRIARDDAEQQLSYTRVVSPMDGVVSVRNVQIGTIIASGINNVGGGTTVMTISDLSRVFVIASVDESDIGKVAVGQPVVVTADAFPGKRFDGKVVQIAVHGVNSSNVVTFDVKIEVLDSAKAEGPGSRRHQPDMGREADAGAGAAKESRGSPVPSSAGLAASSKSLLKPEMTANVEIVAAAKDDVLTIPAEAVVRQRGKHTVEVISGSGARETREVEVGISDGLKTEVLKGLAEGKTVAVNRSAAESRWRAEQGGPRPPMMMGGGRRH